MTEHDTAADPSAQDVLDSIRAYATDDRPGHSRRIVNPVTEDVERPADLPEDGYKRRFLETLLLLRSPDVVDLSDSPVLTFDTDRWAFHDDGDRYVLVKRDAETQFDELVLGEGGESN